MDEIGIDVGGTFTDLCYRSSHRMVFAKADTTDFDLKQGVLAALDVLSSKVGVDLGRLLEDTDRIVYSTTVGTNALLERRGPALGVITTAGFEQTLAIGRGRSWADGLSVEHRRDRARAQRPAPLVPAHRIGAVSERLTSTGEVLAALDDDDVRRCVRELVDAGVQGFVVNLLYSYVSPEHERRIRDVIREEYPEETLGHYPVILSSDASPEMGEYRRLTTCILDAFLRVMTEQHLLELSEELLARGYHQPLLVAKCTGGASSLSRARPIHLYGSGPVAGISGGRRVSRDQYGLDQVLITDMGGTSFDLGIVAGGSESSFDNDPVIDRWRVQVPVVAHWSLGAGGGSIASVSDGVLQIGPRSARAMPGPACYGRGGYEPTVTDADVVLGYVDPAFFLGGRFSIQPDLAYEAIEDNVAGPLGKTVVEAAWEIKQMVDGYMGHEIYRLVATNVGIDPREFTALAFGGAGPLHAAGFCEAADITSVLVPHFGGVSGAFGTLSLDVQQVYEVSFVTLIHRADGRLVEGSVDQINRAAEALLGQSQRDLADERPDVESVRNHLSLLMRFGQQRHTMPVPLPRHPVDEEDLVLAASNFADQYAAAFGREAVFLEAGIEALGLRLEARIGAEHGLRLPDPPPVIGDPGKDARRAYWGPREGWLDTAVYLRDGLDANHRLDGPVLVESEDTVCVVPPGWTYLIDQHRNGMLTKRSDVLWAS